MPHILRLVRARRAQFWLLAVLYGGSELACAATVPPQQPASVASAPSAAEPASAAPPDVSVPRQVPPNPPAASSLVEFIGIGRGDRVADLGAGVGYSILAWVDAVGPSGIVYSRHDPRTQRDLPRPEGGTLPLPDNFVLLHTPLDAPLPTSATGLDEVVFLFAYSDLLAPPHDRRAFHAGIYRAIKPGGTYVIGEHGSLPTPDPRQSERVDPEVIRGDIEATGFRFVEAAAPEPPSATAAPSGPHSASTYLLKFRKPE